MTSDLQYDFIGWGITERCNLACPHCYSAAKKTADDELTTDECKAVIDQLANMRIGAIGWTGGEPLLRKDLEELMRYAAGLGLESGITTNGIPLTRRRVESIAAVGVKTLQISLDGSTPETNRYIREARLKDFDLVINGVKYSIELGIRVHLAMVLCRATLDDVKPYIALAQDLGVKSIRFCGFVPHGFGDQEAMREKMCLGDRLGDLAALVDELEQIESPDLVFDPGFGPLPPAYKFHQCVAGVRTFYICSDGSVYPCTALLDDRFKVGNVRERPVAEILNHPGTMEMANYDHDRIHGPCRECQYFRVCRGACRGAVYAHTGDIDASFPACLFRAGMGESG